MDHVTKSMLAVVALCLRRFRSMVADCKSYCMTSQPGPDNVNTPSNVGVAFKACYFARTVAITLVSSLEALISQGGSMASNRWTVD